ncbi:hypothetical protein D9613_011986 [Agrocybe pediades]|uniref:Uncharacterized protein n=1 Tax=Agrocybe pediades TaxID=84607 RepID=A0A8H4QF44_9AGAR|nr:hypothetical protein D9613_011986 [Agrocybe pediades]
MDFAPSSDATGIKRKVARIDCCKNFQTTIPLRLGGRDSQISIRAFVIHDQASTSIHQAVYYLDFAKSVKQIPEQHCSILAGPPSLLCCPGVGCYSLLKRHLSIIAELCTVASQAYVDLMQLFSCNSYELISRLNVSSICNVYSTDSLESPPSPTTTTFPTIASASTITPPSDSPKDIDTRSDPKAPPPLTQSPSHRRMGLTKLIQSEFNALLPP